MNSNIKVIEQAIAPLRQQLQQHPMYTALNNMDDIRLFMEQHVFAVWDFMSLLKALQLDLTCTQVPWQPTSNPTLARFINEIVFGEESDINELGEPKSHFLMYLESMQQVGASTDTILEFLGHLNTGKSIKEALCLINIPDAVKSFVEFTFDVIATNKTHQIAAVFTFGREDLIPDMFMEIIHNAKRSDQKDRYNKLTYYLQRHIDIDGDEHGPLSLQMIEELCKDDAQKWAEVQQVSIQALQKRIALWDSVQLTIESQSLAY